MICIYMWIILALLFCSCRSTKSVAISDTHISDDSVSSTVKDTVVKKDNVRVITIDVNDELTTVVEEETITEYDLSDPGNPVPAKVTNRKKSSVTDRHGEKKEDSASSTTEVKEHNAENTFVSSKNEEHHDEIIKEKKKPHYAAIIGMIVLAIVAIYHILRRKKSR